MYDPDTVLFSIRRPWPSRRSTPVRNELRRFPWIPRFFFARRDQFPWWRPMGWYSSPFMWWQGQQYFIPALITIWHHDPQTDGTDNSCSNKWKKRLREAVEESDYAKATFCMFMWKHHGLLHVRHWKIQWDFAQAIRRRLFTRCAYCGKKGGTINLHMSGWAPEKGRENLHFWESEENLFHWGHCDTMASILMKRRRIEAGPLKQWEKAFEEKMEPYWGSYSWWREAVLDESRELAVKHASEHVQRSMANCPVCKGEGSKIVAGFDSGEKSDECVFVTVECSFCDGTGHPKIENPIFEGDVA
jgi:hypothetical protein